MRNQMLKRGIVSAFFVLIIDGINESHAIEYDYSERITVSVPNLPTKEYVQQGLPMTPASELFVPQGDALPDEALYFSEVEAEISIPVIPVSTGRPSLDGLIPPTFGNSNAADQAYLQKLRRSIQRSLVDSQITEVLANENARKARRRRR